MFTKSRTPVVIACSGVALFLAACATPSSQKLTAAPTAPVSTASTTPAAATPAPSAAAAGTAQSQVATLDLSQSRQAAPNSFAARAQPYVYFDFDSAVVRSEFKDSIDAHARQLLATPDKRLRIEGHTDERGGREYNLALGQQRADAVARSLELLGVPTARLEVVSFGEESPKAEGASEEAWAKNRRAALRNATPERTAQAAVPR
jgi:peptidoglycan-associated lipoprotein